MVENEEYDVARFLGGAKTRYLKYGESSSLLDIFRCVLARPRSGAKI